jgi:hypothetical protein
MTELCQRDQLQPFAETSVSSEDEAIHHLKQAIAQGKHWYIALLEAIGLWTMAEEEYNGRRYRYLIGGEALDWLLLAERLCQEVDYLIAEDELTALLFFGIPPLELDSEQFRHLIGDDKYRAHLNYYYGVTVEEALLLATEEETLKEQRVSPFNENNHLVEEAYERIYGAAMTELLKRFRREKHYSQLHSMGFGELKEFTYWLFKYRLKECDKARVASDTKRALNELRRQWALSGRKRGASGGSI